VKNAFTISIEGIPEALYGMRLEVASIVRELADSEAIPQVALRLREVADAFECGARPDEADDVC